MSHVLDHLRNILFRSTVVLMATQQTLLTQEIPFTRYELPNGLTVILHEDHRLPLVSANIWYYVGSKDEPPGRSGFAHLFEHLMFMGTNKVPYPQFDLTMETSGAWNNATTSEDRTTYFETGPRHLLDTFLFLESDRMASLGDSMTQEKLDAQRDVVRNERRQSYENRPYGKAYLEIPERLYPKGHPYHEPIIGSHEDLERATVEDVKDFFRKFYFPRNASLAIVGDFEPAAARELVARHFGPLPSLPPAPRKQDIPQPRLDGIVRVTLTDTVELPLSIFVWHSPPAYQGGDADLDVVATILGGGKASRLYKALVYEKKLAQEVMVFQGSRYLGSEFHVAAYARPGVSQDELEAEVDKEVARVCAEGLELREVERARNRIDTSFWGRTQSLPEKADLLNAYQFHFGDPGAIGKDRARYERVTPESAKRWAKQILEPDSRLILRVVPQKNES